MGDSKTISFPAHLNGPYQSANGGVAAGVMAGLVGGPATVRLHGPPPLETPLRVEEVDGRLTALLDSGDTVLSAWSAAVPEIVVPPFDLDAVGAGMPYPDHPAAACVVCGPDHPQGLGVMPAPVASDGDAFVAALRWTPPGWAITDGVLDDVLLWGVLDCPGALAVMFAEQEPVFAALGQVTGVVHRAVRAGEDLVVLGWTLPPEGRKRPCATAVVTLDGEVVAATEQVCIAMPPIWARG